MIQVFAGLFTEGSTDIRFLESIVQRTLETIAGESLEPIRIEVCPITIRKTGLGFVEQVLSAAKKGFDEFGIHVICVHTDADSPNAADVYHHKITPAAAELEGQNEKDYCKTLVAIVPIQETESWMLADKELLKEEIGTKMNNNSLGIDRQPEATTQPKEVIENAIRIARVGVTKRRRHDLTISDLYLPIGQSIDLDMLEPLSSYQDFKENLRAAFRVLHLL